MPPRSSPAPPSGPLNLQATAALAAALAEQRLLVGQLDDARSQLAETQERVETLEYSLELLQVRQAITPSLPTLTPPPPLLLSAPRLPYYSQLLPSYSQPSSSLLRSLHCFSLSFCFPAPELLVWSGLSWAAARQGSPRARLARRHGWRQGGTCPLGCITSCFVWWSGWNGRVVCWDSCCHLHTRGSPTAGAGLAVLALQAERQAANDMSLNIGDDPPTPLDGQLVTGAARQASSTPRAHAASFSHALVLVLILTVWKSLLAPWLAAVSTLWRALHPLYGIPMLSSGLCMLQWGSCPRSCAL